MRVRTLAVTVLVVGAMAGIAVPGDRIILTHSWDHPCPNPQELTCNEEQPSTCWCEADWDVADNWFGDNGYPSDPGDYALIRHSNTAYAYCDGGASEGELCSEPGDCPDACVGGLNDGDPCTDDDDCPGQCEGTGKPCLSDRDCLESERGRGSCINKGTCTDEGTCKTERYLLIDLSEEDIYRLDIKTRNTAVPDDKLDIRFDGHWLTVGHLVIDATNGPVKVRVIEGAKLRTDPTD